MALTASKILHGHAARSNVVSRPVLRRLNVVVQASPKAGKHICH